MSRKNRSKAQISIRKRNEISRPFRMSNRTSVGTDIAGNRAHIMHISAGNSQKDYTCPGCHRNIPMRQAHVVAWPVDRVQGIDERRHWHSICWEKCGSVIV